LLDGQHDHFAADVDAVVEVDDVLVDHADAARGDPAPDGRGSVGAVDAIDGATQIHGAGTERILWASGHEARQIGLALQHLGGRRSIRAFGPARHRLGAGPGEALTADTDAVTDRFAVAEHEVEISVRRIDDNGAGRFTGAIIDDLAFEAGRLRDAIVLLVRNRGGRRLLWYRRA